MDCFLKILGMHTRVYIQKKSGCLQSGNHGRDWLGLENAGYGGFFLDFFCLCCPLDLVYHLIPNTQGTSSHTHILSHTHSHTHQHTNARSYTHTHTHAHTHTRTHALHVRIHIRARAYTSARVHTHTYTHVHVYTHVHTHMVHAHTQTCHTLQVYVCMFDVGVWVCSSIPLSSKKFSKWYSRPTWEWRGTQTNESDIAHRQKQIWIKIYK